jgi:FkbM family methyltransferase
MSTKLQPEASAEAAIEDVIRRIDPRATGLYSPEYLRALITDSLTNTYEDEELKAFKCVLADCDRFIDVGANVGQYAYNANLAMRGGEIVCIEANPFLIPVLEALAAHAQQQHGRGNDITVAHAAVSDRKGQVKLFVSTFAPGSSLVSQCDSGHETAVDGVPLDAFYRPSHKTMIKIDIEGAEYRALIGAESFLSSVHTVWFCELHGWGDAELGKYPLDVCRLFRRNGYAIRHVGARSRNHYFFYKAGPLARWFAFAAALPRLGTMAFVYRHAKFCVPFIRFLRDRVIWKNATSGHSRTRQAATLNGSPK